MDRRFFIGSMTAYAGMLAGCSENANSGPVYLTHMVHVSPEMAPKMLGVWKGPFTPMSDRGEGGEAVLNVTEIDNTFLRGTMTWTRDGALWQEQNLTAAMAPAGHYNLMSTHAMMYRKGPETWMVADILMNDGNWYQHRLARTDVDFSMMHHG